jgi:hypothetical protein
MLNKPQSQSGEVVWENSNGFFMYVCDTSQAQFDAYVKDAREQGFKEDYKKGYGLLLRHRSQREHIVTELQNQWQKHHVNQDRGAGSYVNVNRNTQGLLDLTGSTGAHQ